MLISEGENKVVVSFRPQQRGTMLSGMVEASALFRVCKTRRWRMENLLFRWAPCSYLSSSHAGFVPSRFYPWRWVCPVWFSFAPWPFLETSSRSRFMHGFLLAFRGRCP
ncbi:hypothetical protein Bca4012_062934 [Brassica carinata]